MHDQDTEILDMEASSHRGIGAEQGDKSAHTRPSVAPGRSEFFLETEAWSEVMAAVLAAMREGTKAVLVEGDSGSGKSVFLSRLAATVSSACVLELRYPFGEAALCSRLAQAFGATREGTAELAAVISRRADHGVLIAVDDAHNLSPFALRALLDLQRMVAQQGGVLSLVLSAPPGELQRRIQLLPAFAPFRSDALAVFSLPALSDAEAEEYLRALVDGPGRPPLETQQTRALARLARGIPGQLDRIAADVLRGVQPRPWRKTRAQSNRRRLLHTEWWAPAVIGAAVVAATVLGYQILFTPAKEQTSAPLVRIEPMATDTMTEPLSGLDALEAETPAPEPVAPVSPPSSPASAATGSTPPASPSPTPPAQPATPAVSARAAAGPIDDVTWLLGQDPRRYTIQLASAPDEEKARQFISRHTLSGRTIALATVRGSYIVLHGSFATHSDARQAIAGLPQALRRNEPFARRIESVRELIAEN